MIKTTYNNGFKFKFYLINEKEVLNYWLNEKMKGGLIENGI